MTTLVQVTAEVHATLPRFARDQIQSLRKEGKLTLQTPELTPCINWADTTMLQVSSTN